jgi:Ni2+-binding GTPase involved in maturation of urease and hydrogenase
MIRFVPLGGFLGAGKTTTMLAAAKLLERRGERVSLVTNDQGADLVDTQLARAAGIGEIGEVTGGCFCCRFDDLAAVVTRLAEQVNPTVVIAEAVGSCTDLQSTVVRPLRKLHGDQFGTAPLTVTVDPVRYAAMRTLTNRTGVEPDLAYLYRHQLAETDIVAVNKTDLLTPAAVQSLTVDLAAAFPHAEVIAYSAATGSGLSDLVARWETASPAGHTPFAIDYDRYAAAEAELAWTNQTFPVTGPGFSLSTWTRALLDRLSADTASTQAIVGHIKVRLTAADGAVKASLTDAGAAPRFDQHDDRAVTQAEVTLNARVGLSPDHLDAMISAAVAAADTACGTRSGERTGDIFQPAYPTPVHHL